MSAVVLRNGPPFGPDSLRTFIDLSSHFARPWKVMGIGVIWLWTDINYVQIVELAVMRCLYIWN